MLFDKKIFLTFIIIYLCVVFALYCFQRKMIFYPDKNFPNINVYETYGIKPVNVTTSDNLGLTGWWKKAQKDKPTLIFFHGNAGHHGHRMQNILSYIDKGFGVLLAGYRGYGGNPGSPSETGFYKDAEAYMHHLINEGIDENKIIVYGQSIGTGVAVRIAYEYKNIQALILEAPYTSLPDVAAKTYFFIPVHFLMHDKFDNLSKIKEVKSPLLIMHGTKDHIIPSEMGRKLYEAGNSPKELYYLEGYGHNDIPFKRLSSKTLDFLTKKESP